MSSNDREQFRASRWLADAALVDKHVKDFLESFADLPNNLHHDGECCPSIESRKWLWEYLTDLDEKWSPLQKRGLRHIPGDPRTPEWPEHEWGKPKIIWGKPISVCSQILPLRDTDGAFVAGSRLGS